MATKVTNLYERDFSGRESALADEIARLEQAGGTVNVWGNSSIAPVYTTRKPAAEQPADKVTPLRLTDEQRIAVMRFDSPYQAKARAIIKASEDEVGIYLASDSVPNDLAIRIAWGLAEAELNAVHRSAAVEAAMAALRELANNNLNDSNCASVEVAASRVRNIAAAALAEAERLRKGTMERV